MDKAHKVLSLSSCPKTLGFILLVESLLALYLGLSPEQGLLPCWPLSPGFDWDHCKPGT